MSAQGQTGPTTQDQAEALAIRLWKLVTPEEIRADEAGVKDSLFMAIAAEVERQITAARAQAWDEGHDSCGQRHSCYNPYRADAEAVR